MHCGISKPWLSGICRGAWLPWNPPIWNAEVVPEEQIIQNTFSPSRFIPYSPPTPSISKIAMIFFINANHVLLKKTLQNDDWCELSYYPPTHPTLSLTLCTCCACWVMAHSCWRPGVRDTGLDSPSSRIWVSARGPSTMLPAMVCGEGTGWGSVLEARLLENWVWTMELASLVDRVWDSAGNGRDYCKISNIRQQILKLKCFLSCLGVVFTQSIEARY